MQSDCPCASQEQLPKVDGLARPASSYHPRNGDRQLDLRKALGDLLWNSLLLAYRDLAQKSLEGRGERPTRLLRSSMLRGLRVVRQQLRLTFEASQSRDPQSLSHAPLKSAVKSYSSLATNLWISVDTEFKATGRSGWLSFYGNQQNSRHLTLGSGLDHLISSGGRPRRFLPGCFTGLHEPGR